MTSTTGVRRWYRNPRDQVFPEPTLKAINTSAYPELMPESTLIDSSWLIAGYPGRKQIVINQKVYDIDAEVPIGSGKTWSHGFLYHLRTPVVDLIPIRRARL